MLDWKIGIGGGLAMIAIFFFLTEHWVVGSILVIAMVGKFLFFS